MKIRNPRKVPIKRIVEMKKAPIMTLTLRVRIRKRKRRKRLVNNNCIDFVFVLFHFNFFSHKGGV